jgi:hypothetical protein
MTGMISRDRLLERYRNERERDPAEPPLETAARVLAWAGDRLDREDVRWLVDWACTAFLRDGIPPELRLSPRTVTLIEQDELLDNPESDLLDYPESDRTALLAAGLVERDSRHWPALSAWRDDLAIGRRSLRDLSRAEYDLWNVDWLPDETGWSPADVGIYFGWIPVGIVAIVAGIVVGFISGDWSQFLLIALGGTILGYVTAIVAVVSYVALDNRWLRLGRQVDAAGVVFLSVGSAVPLLLAVLVLARA